MKYLTDQELHVFFKEFQRRRLEAETEYAYKLAVRNEAFFRITYYCGLRVSETTLLRVEDYNHLRNELHCVRLKHGHNNTLRILDESIIEILKLHLRVNKPIGYLFTNFVTNKPISRKTMDVVMKQVCLKVQIPVDKSHCHTLRHTRAIYLAEAGCDIKEIQYWLGHHAISSTLIYMEFTSAQQQTLYNKLKKRRTQN